LGAYAESQCLPERGVIALKPASLSYEEAVALAVGGLEALQYIRRAQIRPGQTVLIIGAGGSIGTFAVQLAKHFAAEVTAVDSTAKLEMLCALGADHVIDYTREDLAKRGATYDVIIEVTGKVPFSRIKKALKPDGVYVSDRREWAAIRKKQTTNAPAARRAENLTLLKELIAARKIKTVIDRTYPLEQMAEAHQYAETGLKKGNIIITVESP
jgi:NADPH:quinone reductase-like Zn-dependent oxidoreductase